MEVPKPTRRGGRTVYAGQLARPRARRSESPQSVASSVRCQDTDAREPAWRFVLNRNDGAHDPVAGWTRSCGEARMGRASEARGDGTTNDLPSPQATSRFPQASRSRSSLSRTAIQPPALCAHLLPPYPTSPLGAQDEAVGPRDAQPPPQLHRLALQPPLHLRKQRFEVSLAGCLSVARACSQS